MIVLGAVISACGNTTPSADNLRVQTNGVQTSSDDITNTTNNTNTTPELKCSNLPNVMGNDNQVSSQYRTCKNGTTVGNIALYPADQTSKSVCVFPIQVTGQNQARALPVNPTSPNSIPVERRFIFQCATIQGTGSLIQFPGLAYNAVYVTNYQNARTMAYCLAYGDVTACAASVGISVSFGQIAQ